MRHNTLLHLLVFVFVFVVGELAEPFLPKVHAQRTTDLLDRGLVAIPSGSATFVSWRIMGEEYYDVTYNLYRDGQAIATGLQVSNYKDASGTAKSQYQVAAVVRGVEQERCAAVTRWDKAYLEIALAPVTDRRGNDVTSHYIANDASLADVDGDGVAEILLKRLNSSDGDNLYPTGNTTEFDRLDVYRLDGTLLWYIDVGPNTISSGGVETNIVAYDWDSDGKAEVVARIGDGGIIHQADGTEKAIGQGKDATRNGCLQSANMTYQITGAEYLVYLEGATGKPYSITSYPLPRGDVNDWGDGYGHRANKFFFGAPFLDGRHPSLFLARGIYSKHHFKAFDINPTTHSLTLRWEWKSDGLDGTWFGQGYHNYGIADVDWDGRDEIVYGSMVIDDNGKGLSTTGLGHGDAQHCSDLDPYRHGQEIFACNENAQGANLRDATTSKIYYYKNIGRDCGRAMAGNFYNTFPGCQCVAVSNPLVSAVTSAALQDSWTGITQNFRIYWDGDLCEESLDGDATEGNAVIYKGGQDAAICSTSDTKLCNWTKNTPTAQGDILGDWREELILRTTDNQHLRIYSTTIPTTNRNYTLWHDHQYRQGMVWEMCGYNQPPHASYFLGALEGITQAPPPLTMTGRTEVANGGTITTTDEHLILCETGNMTVSIAEGAAPYMLTVNTPTWVQGANSNSGIKTTTYTHTLTGGALTGTMRLVKQGDGILQLNTATHTYTGPTNIWAGTLNFDGILTSSPLWLNRFAVLNSQGGEFRKGISMDYAAELHPGGPNTLGSITTDTLTLNMGARIVFDLYSHDANSDMLADCIHASALIIQKKNWSNGPTYLTPVFEFAPHPAAGETAIRPGEYCLMTVKGVEGNIENIVLEGLSGQKTELEYRNDSLLLVVYDQREATDIAWRGSENNIWDLNNTPNFVDANLQPTAFVSGDRVWFTDSASTTTVSLQDELVPDSVIIDATKAYTFTGTGYLSGDAVLAKRGSGTLTISGDNAYTGGTRISGGTIKVSQLSNKYSETGQLGAMSSDASRFVIENGATLQTTAAVEMGSPIKLVGTEGGTLNNSADFAMDSSFSGTQLTKKGNGWLKFNSANGLSRLVITAGTVEVVSGNTPASTVELQGGTLQDDCQSTSHTIYIPKGKSATWKLTNSYYTAYGNRITGEGTLTIVPVNTVSRVRITGDWSAFTGTIKHTTTSIWLPLDAATGLPNGTLNIAEGAVVTNVCKSFAIGTLTGKGSLAQPYANFQNKNAVSGSNTWKVGNNQQDFTFEGTIIDEGGTNKAIFQKVGSCKMTVKGAWTNSGAVSVTAGQLHLASTAKLGTGALTVSKGATLSGTTATGSSLTNSAATFSNGSTLLVGNIEKATTGQIDFGGKNVTFSSGSTLRLGVSRCASSRTTGGTSIQNINRLTINGTISLYIPEGHTLALGDSVLLWKDVTTVSGTPKLESQVIDAGQGLFWDITDMAQGILRVTDEVPASIGGLPSTDNDNEATYDLSGRRINANEATKGIIIRGKKKVLR